MLTCLPYLLFGKYLFIFFTHFLIELFVYLLLSSESSLFQILALCQISGLQIIFSQSVACLSSSQQVFLRAFVSYFIKSNLSLYDFGVKSKKFNHFFLCFHLRFSSFTFLFKFVIHFKLIFVQVVRLVSRFISFILPADAQLFQDHFLKVCPSSI